MAAAAAWPRLPEPWLDDPDYLGCLACVIEALRARQLRRRSEQARRPDPRGSGRDR